MKTKPYNRHETFLAALTDSSITVPTPLSREELYLAKIAGESVTIPAAPYNRYETYLAKIVGQNVTVPVPASRLETFLYKACGYDVQEPVPANREEIFWKRYIGSEVAGNEIVITDALAGTIRAAVAQIEGKYGGSGSPAYDNPRPITAYSEAIITLTDVNDEAISIYTIPFDTQFDIYKGRLDLVSGVLTNEWGSITYDGTESWSKLNDGDTDYFFRNPYSNVQVKVGTEYRMCSHYMNNTVTNNTTAKGYYAYNSSGRLFLQIRPDNFSSTTDNDTWKTYLESEYNAGTPVQVAFMYSTPATKELTPTDINLSEGYNKITCNCGTITLKYTPDL